MKNVKAAFAAIGLGTMVMTGAAVAETPAITVDSSLCNTPIDAIPSAEEMGIDTSVTGDLNATDRVVVYIQAISQVFGMPVPAFEKLVVNEQFNLLSAEGDNALVDNSANSMCGISQENYDAIKALPGTTVAPIPTFN